MGLKSTFSGVLRNFNLLYFADMLRYHIMRIKNKKANALFKSENPSILLPPDYLMYESFQLNYDKYYNEGYKEAQYIANHLKKHKELKDVTILDWGCGPARIIRHFPKIATQNCSFYGTDYNKKSITWNSENLPDIQFNLNTIEASLPYKNDFFDIIYSLSVLTHLSEKQHYEWIKELKRILKPHGILYITTQGDNFKTILTNSELAKYQNDTIIVRGKVKEGHRTYSAFQPVKFMEQLLKDFEILEHIVQKPQNNWLPQDIWIVRKK
ncbi:MAG: class I SAM-dependent methyltransferase [Flavobacteriaceae bacterium]|nr:class I SAM-dependent methyltransferase [Allomuricauda sp.]MCB0457822.1 class I SAM-dependent methyltransferase [Flavobacteriaceae bacterium]